MYQIIDEYEIRCKKFDEYIKRIEKECDGDWDCNGVFHCACKGARVHQIPNDLTTLEWEIAPDIVRKDIEKMKRFCKLYDELERQQELEKEFDTMKRKNPNNPFTRF